jgi:ligand-binding sensor domain-containing protein
MESKTWYKIIVVLFTAAISVICSSCEKKSSSENRDKFYNSDNDSLINIDPRLIGYYEITPLPKPEGEVNALYIDQHDKIYIGSGKAVFVVDTLGTHLNAIALSDTVRGITNHENGDIYVALRNRINVLNSDGIEKLSWKIENERTFFTSVAVDGNNVFVADAGERIVLRFDTTGTFIDRIGDKDSTKDISGFVIPSANFDLAIGQDGSLWAANTGRHKLQNFRPNGDLISEWGEAGAQTAAFCGCCNPVSFTLLGDGSFVTGEKGFSRVKIYNQAGKFVTVAAPPSGFKGPKAIAALAADSQGTIYIADAYEKTIRRFKRKQS